MLDLLTQKGGLIFPIVTRVSHEGSINERVLISIDPEYQKIGVSAEVAPAFRLDVEREVTRELGLFLYLLTKDHFVMSNKAQFI